MNHQKGGKSSLFSFTKNLRLQQLIQGLQLPYKSWKRNDLIKRFSAVFLAVFFLTIVANSVAAQINIGKPRPKVILISLDGATPYLLNEYMDKGVIKANEGLGLLKSTGVVAIQNITCTPSLTAACHTTIGTGSRAARNNINANSFHLVASPFTQNISGFAAPIGGYSITNNVPAPSVSPTAEPIWVGLRKSGKKVVTATFPGADGLNIRLFGLSNSPIIQSATGRTVDYTVPFGSLAGQGSKGFSLTQANFTAASSTITKQLIAAGKVSYSPVQQASLNEKFTVGGVNYDIQVAALDTTNDKVNNYDTLVFFDATLGIKPGPFMLPATGPAYLRASDKISGRFYLEGSSNKAGTAFYVSTLANNLSQVNIVRYGINAIPRNQAVLANVDDINNNVGFWAPQPDYLITERLSPGLSNFSDRELETIYEDQVRTFVDYQTNVALFALAKNPNADLVMIYIEQPDGSEHQFLLTDERQATNPSKPNTIGIGQDKAKVIRYQSYVQNAYLAANQAVQKIIESVGTYPNGKPRSNIIVVSDHGIAPFHTAVNLNSYLTSKGFDSNKVRAVSSGAAVNIYINLQGREPNGVVSRSEYVTLQQKIAKALQELVDTNPKYVESGSKSIFDKVFQRPIPSNLNDPSFGLGTNDFIGQDSGDVFAILNLGYNFNGIQTPVVQRLGDVPSNKPIFSVPNFYGTHGYDSLLPNMSAIFFAAGPNIGHGTFPLVRNIDVVPTINQLLGVNSATTVQGRVLNLKNPR
jgi:predicted AlkP superfamily pyrophosphatase or phosphodiesterase